MGIVNNTQACWDRNDSDYSDAIFLIDKVHGGGAWYWICLVLLYVMQVTPETIYFVDLPSISRARAAILRMAIGYFSARGLAGTFFFFFHSNDQCRSNKAVVCLATAAPFGLHLVCSLSYAYSRQRGGVVFHDTRSFAEVKFGSVDWGKVFDKDDCDLADPIRLL